MVSEPTSRPDSGGIWRRGCWKLLLSLFGRSLLVSCDQLHTTVAFHAAKLLPTTAPFHTTKPLPTTAAFHAAKPLPTTSEFLTTKLPTSAAHTAKLIPTTAEQPFCNPNQWPLASSPIPLCFSGSHTRLPLSSLATNSYYSSTCYL